MDFKDFKDGLTSLSLVLFIFSLTFMMGSVVLKPYLALEPNEVSFIVVICIINIVFSLYYLLEAIRLEKIFKLEEQHIIKFGKRIGIVTCFYTPQLFLFISLYFRGIHELELMMVFLIVFMEILLIGLVFKEVYDLVFLNDAQREYDLEANRKRYIERDKRPLPGDR